MTEVMVTNRGRTLKLLTVAISLIAIAGCTLEAPLSVDAEYFEGLDVAVVAEVLNNPVGRQKIEDEPILTRGSMAQGIVINFITCRDALRVYQGWLNTGVAPDLEPLPIPTTPLEPSFSGNQIQYGLFETGINSGELDQLRSSLTAEGSCGQWIPAVPGALDGPTVKDVVEAGS